MQEIVVPVDDSAAAWKAAEVGASLAAVLAADLTLLTVIDPDTHADASKALLERGAEQLDRGDVRIGTALRVADHSVAEEIEAYVEARPGAVLVMATHGRGRSSALVGSVADDVLGRTFGPIMLIGPKVDAAAFSGPVIVAVDGSELSERAAPLGVAWAIELGVSPWIVHCLIDEHDFPADVDESAYVASLAQTYTEQSKHQVEFEELHGEHPETAVPRFAESSEASMIVATTHGRTGMRRLTMGSVVSRFVRHATCPVFVERPPHAAE